MGSGFNNILHCNDIFFYYRRYGWFDLEKFTLTENPKLAGLGLISIFLINILGSLCAFAIPIGTLILIKIYLKLNGEKIDEHRASIR